MKHVWVVGDGGIGNALYLALKAKNYRVTVLSRKKGVDLFNPTALHDIAQSEYGLPDVIINTCGILHDENHLPEKTLTQLTPNWLLQNITANVSISIHLAQVIDRYLSPAYSVTFCAFSARLSSISDNQKGGWYSYRMSKAMLNMFLKNLAIEWHVKSPQSIVFGYHPGTVDTALSKPFQHSIPKKQLFSPEEAAGYCLEIVFNTELDKHGKLIDWQGLTITP